MAKRKRRMPRAAKRRQSRFIPLVESLEARRMMSTLVDGEELLLAGVIHTVTVNLPADSAEPFGVITPEEEASQYVFDGTIVGGSGTFHDDPDEDDDDVALMLMNGATLVSNVVGPTVNGNTVSFSLTVPSSALPAMDADGTTYTLRLEGTREDRPGRLLIVSFNLKIDTILGIGDDVTAPVVTNLKLSDSEPQFPTPVASVPGTTSADPVLSFRLSDQRFETETNTVQAQLFRVGESTPIGQTSVEFAPGAPGTVAQDVSIQSDLGGRSGQQDVFVRATDSAGNTSDSAVFSFFVVQPNQQTASAPATPVFSTAYKIAQNVRPWTNTFDKTTQTIWFTMEDGHRLGQFDPATETVRYYDVNLPGLSDTMALDPHGVFFDLNTHLTPRVWFVYRNDEGIADTDPKDKRSRVAYLDLTPRVDAQGQFHATGELVTFDLFSLTGLNLRGSHNIQVDDLGTVWLTAEESDAIVELDFDQANGTINSRSGRAIVHKIPHDLGGVTGTNHFHVHGLQIVIDERTGERYVYFGDAENQGRVGLLRPGEIGGEDRWFEWAYETNIDQETIGTERPPNTGHALFLAIDDRETPGEPEDDRLIFSDGGRPGGTPYGSVRSLDVGTAVRALQLVGSRDLPAGTTTALRTVQVPRLPTAVTPTSQATTFASTVQTFVDREGNVFFLDARNGVGRLDLDDPRLDTNDFVVNFVEVKHDENDDPGPLVAHPFTMVNAAGAAAGTQNPFSSSPATTRVPLSGSANATERLASTDFSAQQGIDQYQLSRDATRQQQQRAGQNGPFRGALNAGSVLFSSLAQSDHLTTTVFAETVRRQMSVVVRTDNPTNGLTQGRIAFSVRRDGNLIATVRADGSILDEHVNLSELEGGANPGPGLLFDGDVSAVINEETGVVTVFGISRNNGINQNNGLAIFQFNGGTGPWTNESLTSGGNWSSSEVFAPAGSLLVGNPTAFLGSAGQAGAMATSANGDLLLYNPLLSAMMIDVNSPTSPVFSSVAILNSESSSQLFVYGTNQKGQLLEFQFTDTAVAVGISAAVVPTGNPADRSLMVFQDVYATLEGATRHVFAVDGNARLVHFEIDPVAGTTVENVTAAVQANNKAYGYLPFQQSPDTRYGGRVYSGLAADVNANGEIFVYGTNGGDLVEFKRSASGEWQVANLTNDIHSTSGPIDGPERIDNQPPNQRVPANVVFGAPAAYLLDNGERHIVQINADGEVVEYYFQEAGQPFGRFQTQNITLRLAPTGISDTYRTGRGVPLVVPAVGGVLANDKNPTKLPRGDNSVSLPDPRLSAVQITAPTKGNLVFNGATGAFTYTPTDANFVGTDTFLYQVRNEFTESPAVQVTILVEEPVVGTIIDDGRPGYSQKGTWNSRGDADSFQGDFRESARGTGRDVATWTFTRLPAGEYEVFTRWDEGAARATNAPYAIFDNTRVVGGRLVNQRQAPSGELAAGFVWQSLGTVRIESGTLKVTLTDKANGSVVADAVRVVRRALETTLDDGMFGYSQRGSWQTRRNSAAVGGDFRESARGTGRDVAEWKFTDLPDGEYEVFTHWVAGGNRASNAPFSVFDNSTRLLTQNVNQKVAPAGDLFEGFRWHSLGTVQVTSGILKVTLSDKANGLVIADAVRIAPTSGGLVQAFDAALLDLLAGTLTTGRK